jgi:hypothetical protein
MVHPSFLYLIFIGLVLAPRMIAARPEQDKEDHL